MFSLAHLAAGLIVGKTMGNYPAALIGALVIDLDHIILYLRHNVFSSWKKFWGIVTRRADPYRFQRNYLHSFMTWIVVSFIVYMIDAPFGMVFSVGYLTHLLLDMLDGSDFYPLYPVKWKVNGLIPYMSKAEAVLTVLLFVIYFVI